MTTSRRPKPGWMLGGLASAAAVVTSLGCEDPSYSGYPNPPAARRFEQPQNTDLFLKHENEMTRLKEALAAKDLEIAALQAEVEQLRDDAARGGILPDDADGLVQWVDHKSTSVLINMGESDGLQIKQILQVSGLTPNGQKAEKGEIEVTKVLAGHLAEGRVMFPGRYPAVVVGDKLKKLQLTLPGETPPPTVETLNDPDGRFALPPGARPSTGPSGSPQ